MLSNLLENEDNHIEFTISTNFQIFDVSNEVAIFKPRDIRNRNPIGYAAQLISLIFNDSVDNSILNWLSDGSRYYIKINETVVNARETN